MDLSVHSSNVRYAVLRVSGESGSHGRVVIAYEDEQSLRKLIAEPSILARGFAHPEDAGLLASSNCVLRNAVHPNTLQTRQRTFRKRNLAVQWMSRLAHWKTPNVAYSGVQFAFASIVAVFYSRNIVSSIIRTILGL